MIKSLYQYRRDFNGVFIRAYVNGKLVVEDTIFYGVRRVKIHKKKNGRLYFRLGNEVFDIVLWSVGAESVVRNCLKGE